MKAWFVAGIVLLAWAVVAGPRATHADEVTGDEGDTVSKAPATPVKKKAKAKGSATREKETEGTEAPDRFEADTVIKSQYQLDGKQLEVDPD
jgi:hypothetical protein